MVVFGNIIAFIFMLWYYKCKIINGELTMKKIKQINNLVIKQDTARQISYFGNIMDNPNHLKYSVFSPSGICLEDGFASLEDAEDFCKKQ